MKYFLSRSLLSATLLISSIAPLSSATAQNTSSPPPSTPSLSTRYPIPEVKHYWEQHEARQAFLHLSSHGQQALISILDAKHLLEAGQTKEAIPALISANSHLIAASHAQERFTAAENALHPAPQHPLSPNHIPQTGSTDWIPISGDIIASTSLSPEKKARIATADTQLRLGHSDLAAQTLGTIKNDVDYIITLAPLSPTQSSVNRALIFAQGNNNKGAIAALNSIIDSLFFVSENVITTFTTNQSSQ